jgi:hypothetical protein
MRPHTLGHSGGQQGLRTGSRGEQVLTQGPDFHLRNILVAPTLPVLVYQPTKPHSPVPIMSDRNPESQDERTGSVFLCLKFACGSDRHLAIAQTSS